MFRNIPSRCRASVGASVLAFGVSAAASLCNVPIAAAQAGPVPALSTVERSRREEMIRAHFAERQSKLAVLATTTTRAGQKLDWIRPETQLRGRKPAAPPPADPSPSGEESPSLAAQSPTVGPGVASREQKAKLDLEPAARGPEGTVPVLRFDVEAYLRTTASLPATMEQFQPDPPPAAASNNRYYTTMWRNDVTNLGTRGFINAWDSEGPFDGPGAFRDTSIAQSFVSRGSPRQTIEAGMTSSLLRFNGAPRLFVYYTTNNYASSGDNVGGYDQTVAGWVQVSSSKVPGQTLIGPLSTLNGTQYVMEVRTRLFQGNWWVWINDEWIGYYPATLFSTNGLRSSASRISWYGEVYDDFVPASTSTDMGSGRHAVNGFGSAAYMRDIAYYYDAAGNSYWAPTTTAVPTDATCYSSTGPFTDSASVTVWKNWGYFGGPGREDSRCR